MDQHEDAPEAEPDPTPNGWAGHARPAMLQANLLAQFAVADARSRAATIIHARVRAQAELQRAVLEAGKGPGRMPAFVVVEKRCIVWPGIHGKWR